MTNKSLSEPFSPPHFSLTPEGVFHHTEENVRWICSPLEVKAFIRDKSSENWGRLLAFTDADGLLHHWAMPMEMLKGSGEELRGELLRLGVEIAAYPRARNLLIEYIITQKPDARARCVNRIGWHDNVFVLPDKTIGSSKEKILYQSEHHTLDYKQSGTLEDWQKNISQYCAGNSRLIVAVSCAFAAILLKLVDAESGGIHFVGESSTGKTTALRVAASVFGNHDYLSRWRATTNGLEALASIRSDTLLILDELSQIDPKEAGEVAYMLANGMGKARASKHGNTKPRHEWRLLFLSAGEIGLAQHLQDAGRKIKAGQQVRLVDISADAEQGHGIFENLHGFNSGAQLSQTLLQNTQKYYGTPFIHFLEFLTNSNLKQEKESIKKICKLFFSEYFPLESSGQVHRVCERFALIAAAGEVATIYQITGWQKDESFHAVGKCFQSWLEQRGTMGNQESAAIFSQVKGFFELHGDARFSDMDNMNPHTMNRAGFRKTQNGVHTYYVLPEVFSKEICAGFDYRQVCKTLIEANWIMPGKNDLPHRREYLPGLGQSRCYVFTSNLWNT
jgi:putative DNA primase/helicase